KTGHSKKEMREAMKKETWYTGKEAVDFGLADQSCDCDENCDEDCPCDCHDKNSRNLRHLDVSNFHPSQLVLNLLRWSKVKNADRSCPQCSHEKCDACKEEADKITCCACNYEYPSEGDPIGQPQRQISAPRQGAVNKPKTVANNQIIMTRAQMIALLTSWGVESNDQMTDDDLVELIGKGKPAALATGITP